MHTTLRLALGLIALLPALGAAAQRYQFGHVIYELPRHWELGRVDDYQVIYSDDDEVGYYASISIHGGFEPDGQKPEAALRERMKLVLDDDETAEAFGNIQTSTAGPRTLLIAAEQIGRRKMRMHALSVSRGWAYHAFLDARINQDGLQDPETGVSPTFSTLAATKRFIPDGAEPVLGLPTPGPLSGAFAGVEQRFGLNGLQFETAIMQFSKSGRFYDGMPTGGSLKTISPADVLFRFPHECGNYTIKENTIQLSYATGETETMEFERDGDGNLRLKGVYYGRLNPIADGTRLDGTYRDFNYTSFTPGSGVTGGVATERTITLRRSGRWEATRFAGAFGNFDDGAGNTTGGFATSNDKPEQRGTYEIKDGVLVLTDDSGLVSRKPILLMDGLLLLDGTSYLEQDDD
ncbi:MAG: hypothetical protein AAFN41_01915 [Planctomycetota bacterium]